MKKTLVIAALTFALVAIAPAAFAASAPATLTINASVSANCTIGAATLTFSPAYDPVVANAAANLDGSTTMAVACTKGVTPNITTAAPGGTITDGIDNLNYLLFSDSGRTSSFVGGFNMPISTSKTAQTLTIYGRIAGGQDVGVGAYTGTTTITVNF